MHTSQSGESDPVTSRQLGECAREKKAERVVDENAIAVDENANPVDDGLIDHLVSKRE